MNLSNPWHRMRARHVVLLALCSIYVVLMVGQSRRTFPNVDEGAHLLAGIEHSLYGTFDYYRVSPPLVDTVAGFACIHPKRFATCVTFPREVGMRPEFLASIKALSEYRCSFFKEFIVPRICVIPFSILGLLVLAVWAGHHRQVLMLAGLLLFDPNTLAFGAVIGPDVAATAIGIFACWLGYNYLQSETRANALWAGLGTGLALLTKLTWLTAVITLPMTAVICWTFIGQYLPKRTWKQRSADLLLFWCIGLLTLNAGYLFEGTMKPLGEY